ncbi:MAG: DMT family transporter [Amaricoccus sp.]|uniref:DMT family transporter n=1 Tax=Amaricoccus sp. TaxID=1872485 RepID=UPI0033150681
MGDDQGSRPVSRLVAVAALVALGAIWGLTVPLMRVAVSTGYKPLGILVWQNAIMAGLLLLLMRGLRLPVALDRRHFGLMVVVAFFGAALPGYFSFLTAAWLPGGVRAIIVAAVPMFVLPIALAVGFERPDARRALGVLLGAGAIVVIALPGAHGGTVATGAVLLALIAPVSYAVEASYLAWRGSHGLHPFQLLFGTALLLLAVCWPLAEITGQRPPRGWPWGAAEWAVVISGVLNALAYSGYVWLIGQAGSVFASQIAYLVTGFGVVWSMILLGERYGVAVWLALGLMLVGVALVQPRPRPSPLEPEPGRDV